MSTNIYTNVNNSSNIPYVHEYAPTNYNDDLSTSIKSICKNLLRPNVKQAEKTLFLSHLRSIKNTLETDNSKIENPKEIIQEVTKIISCLEKNKSYAKKLWQKEVEYNEGKLSFSDSLKLLLDDEYFEYFLQVMPEKYQEQVIDCNFDDISLQRKPLETLLKYFPNMHKEALERITTTWNEQESLNILEMNPFLQEISLEERTDIIEWSFKCFHEDMSVTEKIEITKIIARTPSKNRKKLTECALKYFHEALFSGGDYEKMKMFEALFIASIPSNDRKSVIIHSLQCFHEGIVAEEKIEILGAIAEISPEYRESIIKYASVCFHEDMPVAEKIQIIKAINSIDPKDRESVTTYSLQCFHKNASLEGISEIIETIAEIPSKHRENVIEYSTRCFYEGISVLEKTHIIGVITGTPVEDQETIVGSALEYFHNGIVGYANIQILEAFSIAEIPIEDRESVITSALRCFYEGISLSEKIRIIEAISAIPIEDRETFVTNALEYFYNGIAGYTNIQMLEALVIAGVPLQDQESVVIYAVKCFHEDIPLDQKIHIIQTIAEIPLKDRENTISSALSYFQEGLPEYRHMEMSEALFIATIPPEDRKSVITYSLQCFYKNIPVHEKILLIEAITEIPSAFRENVIKCTLKCFRKGVFWYERIQIIKTIAEIPFEDQENVVTSALKCFHDGIHGYEKIQLFEFISNIPPEDRENVITCALQYFHKDIPHYENMSIVEALFIATIPSENRENTIEWSIKCFSEKIRMEDRLGIVETIAIIPKEERSFIDDSRIQDFSRCYGLNKDTLLHAYLLPVSLRSEEALLDPGLYDQELINALQEKLSNETLPRETLLTLARYAEDRYGQILIEEHPLIQLAIEFLSIDAIEGIKNPFTLFGKLKALRDIPVDFQTPISSTIPLRINMIQLNNMAIVSTIQRKDLPEKATKGAWDSFKTVFKDKIETNFENAEQALSNLGTSWTDIEGPLFGDPQNYLSRLFDLTGAVSDSEAKFKAIFNSILSKNNVCKNDQFFTEQEEVFIKTLMVIQHCKGGKQGGIADAYQLLDALYKYKLQLSPPMSVEEQSDRERKEEATQFLRDFIQNHPITEESLIEHFKADTFTNAGLFTALFGAKSSEEYLVEVEENGDYVYHLNKAGALEALSHIRNVEKNNLIDYIANILRPLIERTISSDTFIQKLIKEEEITHGVHSSIYLKNSIGHLIGITNELIFDRHTKILDDALLEKTREELLKLFFSEITPEVFISELVRVGVPIIVKKLFLDEKQLVEENAKKLLEQTGYLVA